MTNDKMIYIQLKDHSVSGKAFHLKVNSQYGYLETEPQPDEVELPKYYKSEDYISHTNSKRNAFEWIYHKIRKIAIKQKVKLAASQKPEAYSLLDIGCGTGDFLEALIEENWNVVGIEPNANARSIANLKTKNSVFDTSHLMTLQPRSFDVITLWHVLEHLPKLESHIQLLKSLLKENGTLIIAVPNFNSYDAKYYKSFWAAFDVPRHLWHFSQDSISKLFSEVAMKVVRTIPMKFDAYYVSLLSEKYKNGYMNPIRAFYIGMRSNAKAKRSSEYSSLIYMIKNCKNEK